MTKRKQDIEAAEEPTNIVVSVLDGIIASVENSMIQSAVENLEKSGIIVDADNGHRPVFRDGHLPHLAREYVRLGHEGAWRLYENDMMVIVSFYREEFDKLVCEAAE
jgi:hypothetical protein